MPSKFAPNANPTVAVSLVALVILDLSLFCMAGSVYDCDPDVGPAGVNQCVLLNPNYNNYQWATCLTNSYIQRISGGLYECENKLATYCWYQCMLETYGSEGPQVSGVCLCSKSATTVASPAARSTLSPSCYSPDGSDCSWYANCLEALYPCSGTSAGYAVEYATHFCQLYQQNFDMFSQVGQQWINAVRKCLQVSLAPLLRQYVKPSCKDIRTTAFGSHASCYLKPYEKAPSICDLPLSDSIPLTFTLSEAFVDPATAGETVCGVVEVLKGCVIQWSKTASCLRSLLLEVALYSFSRAGVYPELAAAKIAQQIAALLQWNSKGVQYMGCLVSGLSDSSGALNILVAVDDVRSCLSDAMQPANSRQRRSAPSSVLDVVISDFKEALTNGSLIVRVNGAGVYVAAMAECNPPACANGTVANVTGPPAPAQIPFISSATVAAADRFMYIMPLFISLLLQSMYVALVK
jgi:hypothetical protein